MKRMMVIFENLEPVHLGKDVGVLPRTLATQCGYRVNILSTRKFFSDELFEKDVKLTFFTKYKNRYINKLLMAWSVLYGAGETDVIMIFHGDAIYQFLFFLCKLVNPKLICYVKLDIDRFSAKAKICKMSKEGFIKRGLRLFLARQVDVFTIETKRVFELLKESSYFKDRLHYLPNGFYADSCYDFNAPKKNMLISVGRTGVPQKNNNLLLMAIKRLSNIGDYKFYFIGPVEEAFDEDVANLLKERPDLIGKVILTGNIQDRDRLHDYYKSARVLCFTSFYEGFSLVLLESLYFGAFLVSTDLDGSFDVTDNFKYGTLVDINSALAKDLEAGGVFDIVDYINNNYREIQEGGWFLDSVEDLACRLQDIINDKVDVVNDARVLSDRVFYEFNWLHISKELDRLLS